MLGRLGSQLSRTLHLSGFSKVIPGPTNGTRALAAFAGNFRTPGYAQPAPQEEAAPAPKAGGSLREVPFSKDITNSVRVMGRLGADPEMRRLDTGRVVTKIRIALSKPKSTDGTEDAAEWIEVESWDSPGNELASMAANGLQKGSRVAVQGRLKIDSWTDRNSGEKKFKPKIVAEDLALVSDSMGAENTYASQGGGYTSGGSSYNSGGSSYASTSAASPSFGTPQDRSREEKWEDYFANPSGWWDNRHNKTNPRAPDFKNKETKEALWIDDKHIPPYVLARLAEENPPAGPELDVTLDELWTNLYEDPGAWWDNRKNKKFPNAPDFVHKDTKQGLKLSDPNAPSYLTSAEALTDLDERFVVVANMEREEHALLWDEVCTEPHKWYDNRVGKRNPKAPDFVNKEDRSLVLWLNDNRNPPDLEQRLAGALRDVSQSGHMAQHQSYGG